MGKPVVRMYHPSLPVGSYADVSPTSFEEVWKGKGWSLHPEVLHQPELSEPDPEYSGNEEE